MVRAGLECSAKSLADAGGGPFVGSGADRRRQRIPSCDTVMLVTVHLPAVSGSERIAFGRILLWVWV